VLLLPECDIPTQEESCEKKGAPYICRHNENQLEGVCWSASPAGRISTLEVRDHLIRNVLREDAPSCFE
jgi:hypothetical protein